MEQLERARRYLKRIQKIYSGVFSSEGHDEEAYDDDVISFFIHCYHVRDWIIQQDDAVVTGRQVDAYIDSHLALKVCADLANGSKHYKLTRALRTGSQPHIASKEREVSTWYTGGGGGELMVSKYSVHSNAEILDALLLARESVELWDAYFGTQART